MVKACWQCPQRRRALRPRGKCGGTRTCPAKPQLGQRKRMGSILGDLRGIVKLTATNYPGGERHK